MYLNNYQNYLNNMAKIKVPSLASFIKANKPVKMKPLKWGRLGKYKVKLPKFKITKFKVK